LTAFRVILDANVWVSGLLFPGGTPSLLVDMVTSREILSFHSEALVEEVLRNVRKVGKSETDVRNAWLVIRQFSTLIKPDIVVTQITGKDSDNRILECAVATNAEMIITGDKMHLLPLGSYEGIPILTPRDAYERILAAGHR
jgi:putative PIN family toxin of toxin-antitoxin system